MSDRRPVASVLFFGLLWLLMALPSNALASPSAEELCGPSSRRPVEIRCPRTSATLCVCYLQARAQPAETPFAYAREVIKVAVRRPVRPLRRKLPQLEPVAMRDRFCPSVPTRPPRALTV